MPLVLSVSTQRAHAAMELMSATMEAYSFNPSMLATVQCFDGSAFFVDSAFLRDWKDPKDGEEWVFMFCEHYPAMCFYKEDLNFWANYGRTDVPK